MLTDRPRESPRDLVDLAICRGDLERAYAIEQTMVAEGWTGIRQLRRCPYGKCRGAILRSAVKCRHCGELLPDVLAAAPVRHVG